MRNDDARYAILMSVRAARLADASELARIQSETWSPATSPLPRPASDAPFFDGTPPEQVLVAEMSGRVVGYAKLVPASAMSQRHEELCPHVQMLQGMAVAPEHQGLGIGHLLMKGVCQEARRRGAMRVELKVLSTNSTARTLYRSFGWREEGTLSKRYLLEGRYVDDVLMALDLTEHVDEVPAAETQPVHVDSYQDIG